MPFFLAGEGRRRGAGDGGGGGGGGCGGRQAFLALSVAWKTARRQEFGEKDLLVPGLLRMDALCLTGTQTLLSPKNYFRTEKHHPVGNFCC